MLSQRGFYYFISQRHNLLKSLCDTFKYFYQVKNTKKKTTPPHMLWGVLCCSLSLCSGPLPEAGEPEGSPQYLAVPRIELFWTEISDIVPIICWSHSSSLGVTAALSAPFTTSLAPL